MRVWRRMILFAFFALCAATLGGCFARSVDELYALPQQPDEYYEIQSAIDALMTGGASYAAPSNRQPVQLADLDGDGEDEAIAFLKSDGEKPLRACILDRSGDGFTNVATIEGDGAAFATAEYAQIDGEPGLEIILGRQINDQVLQSMSVYALRENRAVELMSASYTAYTTADLDEDGGTDLFLLRLNPEESAGVAEYYRCVDGQIEREPEALMSNGAGPVKRIITGKVAGGAPAVFVASLYGEDSIITDIFALRDGAFTNITTAGAAGTSAETVRNYFVYGADLDGDGVIELPQPTKLPSGGETQEEPYWLIDWYKITLSGERSRAMTTYHNYSGGWYVELPERWRGRLTVSRGEEVSGVRGYVFSRWSGPDEPPEPIFTVYAFAGDDRNELSAGDGRFPLGEKGDVTYAASLGSSEEARALSREELTAMFHFIQVDWNNGEV